MILLHGLKMILLFPEVFYSIFISLRGIARTMQTAWVIILHVNKNIFANHILSQHSQFQVSVSSDFEWYAIRGMKLHCSWRRCFRSHLKPRNKYSHTKIETKQKSSVAISKSISTPNGQKSVIRRPNSPDSVLSEHRSGQSRIDVEQYRYRRQCWLICLFHSHH